MVIAIDGRETPSTLCTPTSSPFVSPCGLGEGERKVAESFKGSFLSPFCFTKKIRKIFAAVLFCGILNSAY